MISLCVLCPNFVGNSCQVTTMVTEGLHVFTENNGLRLVLDAEGKMIGVYAEILRSLSGTAYDDLAYWIKLLGRTSNWSIETVSCVSKAKDAKRYAIGLAKSIQGSGFYIIWSRQDYGGKSLDKLRLNILERDTALIFFRIHRGGRKIGEEDVVIDLVTAGTIIKTAADAIGIVDKISHAVSTFRRSERVVLVREALKGVPAETVTANEEGTALVHQVRGSEKQTITLEELSKKLGNQDLALIKTYDAQLGQLFEQWTAISAEYEVAGVAEQARLKGQLKLISGKMAKSLNSTMKFIERMGFTLGDHYVAIRAVTEEE